MRAITERSILVVEPDADTRSLYRLCFRRDGLDIVEAADGRDALAKALAEPPALILTEIRLPFVDGHALCDILRRDPLTATVPILVVTADARPVELQHARRSGADAVLVKPVSVDVIIEEMRRLFAADPRHRAAEDAQPERVEPAADIPGKKRMALVRAYRRFSTKTPSLPPRRLVCPACDRPLEYQRSEIGGVSSKHPEQWDYYTCSSCGAYRYRQRTRALRPVG